MAKVIDGDTILVEAGDGSNDLVRLLGVDAPEIKPQNRPDEYDGIADAACLDVWGDRARELAVDRLEGRMVTLLLDPGAGGGATFEGLFSFGRLLAFVAVDGQDFGAGLLNLGLARAYSEAHNSREEEFLDLQRRAQARNAGLWRCREGTPAPAAAATPTPTPTPAPTPQPAAPPLPTGTSPTAPVATPAPASTPLPTPAPTRSSAASPQPTATATPAATPTPTPSPTSTPAPTPTPTLTPLPAPTATAAPTPSPTPPPTPTLTPTPPSSGTGCAEGQIDVNSASAEELDLIIHIGPVRAAEATRLRPFSSLGDLVRIDGIGPSRLADIKAEGLACVSA